jgi:isochorismate pyruvate lyase
LRQRIDARDTQIVDLLVERALRALRACDAARFKLGAFQVSAPMRQGQVFAKATCSLPAYLVWR